MSKDNDPAKYFSREPDGGEARGVPRRKLLRGLLAAAGGVALAGGPAALATPMAWNSSKERIKAESLQDRTHEEYGSHEVVEVVSLQDIQPVTGYKMEHRGIRVERELEANTPFIDLNLLKGNSVSVEVNVDTESQISLNLEELGDVEVDYNTDTKKAVLKVSNQDLIVQSSEVRNSRDPKRELKGIASKGAGIIDITVLGSKDKKLVEDIQDDLENLAVNLALRSADESARSIVEDTRVAFEEEISKEVKYALGEKYGVDISEISVDISWTDKDKNPKIKDRDKHQNQIEKLGGTVTSEGESDRIGLPGDGGQA